MAINRALIGRAYGPFRYEVGLEKIREFAFAVGGGVPSTGFLSSGAPVDLHPWLHDLAAGAESPHGSIIAMPNFAVVFAMAPFGAACSDPQLGIDLLRLVHGEQDFEWCCTIKPGDVMMTSGTITDIYSKAGKDFFVVATESRNQRQDLVVKGRWTAVIRG